MKHIYQLKPIEKNPELATLDDAKRFKVEEVMGKKFTDFEWVKYKQMVLPKNKNS